MIEWERDHPGQGDLCEVNECARAWRYRAEQLVALTAELDAVEREVAAAWQGDAAESWLALHRRARAETDEIFEAYRRCVLTVESFASEMQEILDRARIGQEVRADCEAERDRILMRLSDPAVLVDPDLERHLRRELAWAEDDLAASRARIEFLADDREENEAGLRGRLAAALSEFPSARFGEVSLAANRIARLLDGRIPGEGAESLLRRQLGEIRGLPAAEVRGAWGSLPESLQKTLLLRFPAELGATEGLPTPDRDRANRLLLGPALEEAREALARAEEREAEAMRDPEGLAAARRKVQGLEALWQQFGGGKAGSRKPSLFLYAFDPSGPDQPLSAVAVGNLDVLPRIAVVVRGQDSGVADLEGELRIAKNLRGRDDGLGILLWDGYPTPHFWAETTAHPDSGEDVRLSYPTAQALGEEPARIGAVRLDHTLEGLRALGMPGARLTVIGHSYGTNVVARALALGDHGVDAAVLVGSAGLPNTLAPEDLHMPPERVFVAEAKGDMVAPLGRVPGRYDPLRAGSPFTGIGTEGGLQPDGSVLDPIRGHGAIGSSESDDRRHYFGPNTELTRNLRFILRDRLDRLTPSEAHADYEDEAERHRQAVRDYLDGRGGR